MAPPTYGSLLHPTPRPAPSSPWYAALAGVVAVACVGCALYPVAAATSTAMWASTASRTVVSGAATAIQGLPQQGAGTIQAVDTYDGVAALPAGRPKTVIDYAADYLASGPSFDFTWAVSCLIGCTFLFWAGKRIGEQMSSPQSIAMMAASGDIENRGEWDKRVSMLDQPMPNEIKYISEEDFSKLVILKMQQRYGEEETKRIVKSWKLTEAGEEYKKRFGTHPLMEQIASSYVEGLTTKPKWANPEAIPWVTKVKEGWQTIREELDKAVAMGDEELKKQGSLSWLSVPGDAGAYGIGWKTLGLCDRGYWDEDNTRIFKNTCRILRAARAPIMEAFFAKMPAHSNIKVHSDYTNFVLTFHLGLRVPEGKCWINVGDTRNEWRNGEAMLLDTTFLHEAVNDGDTDRYVLILRVWHPDLTATEIEAITFLFDCLDDSDIITHPDGLMMYDMMKAHRLMEWNAILGPGDTEEESQEIMRKILESQAQEVKDVTQFSDAVKEKLNDQQQK